MNAKTNLQDLAALMAVKSGISIKDVEYFLKELIETIQENLLNDEPVRIKNLGTFKRITVSARESVDVSTGQRVKIPAHSKINFVPDNNLAEAVNEPFGNFPPIPLDPPNQPENESFDDIFPPIEELAPPTRPDETGFETKERLVPIEETPNIHTNPEKNLLPPPRKPSRPKKRRKTGWISTLIFTLVVIVLAGLIALFFFPEIFPTRPKLNQYPSTISIPSIEEPIVEENPAEEDITKEDIIEDVEEGTVTEEEGVIEDIIEEDETVKIPTEKVEENTSEIQEENANIGATVTSAKQYTLQRGDFLTSIAQKEYGNKIFWVYLYEENKEKIKDPNNISAGLTINIPAASKYGINKDDPESVRKATEKQREIYRSFPQQNSRSSQQQYRQQQNRSSQQQYEGTYEQQYNDFPFY